MNNAFWAEYIYTQVTGWYSHWLVKMHSECPAIGYRKYIKFTERSARYYQDTSCKWLETRKGTVERTNEARMVIMRTNIRKEGILRAWTWKVYQLKKQYPWNCNAGGIRTPHFQISESCPLLQIIYIFEDFLFLGHF